MLKFVIPGLLTLVVIFYLNGGILQVQKDAGIASKSDMNDYKRLYDENSERNVETRNEKYGNIVPNFYRLVTDFYEYGWGESFHFSPAYEGESFHQSLRRHEHYLASQLGLKKGMSVLDVGCGVGGPAHEIARFSGANVTGMNIVEYQIQKAEEKGRQYGLSDQCKFIHGDFMNMPVKDETFDAAYGIEATCHAPDKVKLWKEIFRILKPGGKFGVYEWLMTDKYDPENPRHVAIKEGIEIGNALPTIPSTANIRAELEEAGFTVLIEEDRAVVTAVEPVPWYFPLKAGWSLRGMANSPVSRKITNVATWIMERVGIAEEGAHYTAVMLDKTAKDLVAGGETGVFTPAYFVIAQKPNQSA